MTKRSLKVLLVLNVVLLAGLLVVSVSPDQAQAQLGGRGQYMMIAGEVTGRTNQAAVYVLDLRNQRIAAMMYDSRSKKLEPVAGRNIRGDLSTGARR